MSRKRPAVSEIPASSVRQLREDLAKFEELDMSEEAMKSAGSRIVSTPGASTTSDADPRDSETWIFQFDWTDSRKKRWVGKFTNHILSLGELQKVAATQSAMQNGQPTESFGAGMLVVNNAMAHMMYSLDPRPVWAKDLMALTSIELLMKLWEKVRSHEDRYFRIEADPIESTSDEE